MRCPLGDQGLAQLGQQGRGRFQGSAGSTPLRRACMSSTSNRGLDQTDQVSPCSQQIPAKIGNRLLQRQIGQIDAGQIGLGSARHLADVGALHVDHRRVLAQGPGQLA